MTVDLDTRMRLAGGSLRQASNRLAPTTLPPDRRRRALAGLTVVAAVALGAAALVVLPHADTRPDVVVDTPEVPALVPDVVPEGLMPTGATDLPIDAADSDDFDMGTMLVTVFGDPGAVDPFAATDLAVYVLAVDGTDAYIDDSLGSEPSEVEEYSGGSIVAWTPEPGVSVTVGSHSLTGDQVLAVAEGLVIEDRAVRLGAVPPDLPGPLDQVGSAEMLGGLGLARVPVEAPGHAVGYQSEDGERVLSVVTVVGDLSDMHVARWGLGRTAPAEVRGHDGWVGTYDFSADGSQSDEAPLPISSLIWEEASGVFTIVQGFDLPEEDVYAAAESLRPATGEEWAELVALAGRDDDGVVVDSDTESSSSEATVAEGAEGGVPPDVVGGDGAAPSTPSVPTDAMVSIGGEYANGTWAVYIDADGLLCAAVEYGSGGGESCSSEWGRAVLLDENIEEGDTPVLIYGVWPDGATGYSVSSGTSQAITGDGGSAAAPDGTQIYAIVVYGGPVPTEVGFIGADGQVFETAPVT